MIEKLNLRSRLIANEYGETEDTTEARIGFVDKKSRDVFMSFIDRNDLILLCQGEKIIVSWEHWKLEENKQ